MATEDYVSSSDLYDYVAYVKEVAEQYPQMNEDDTKLKIVRDFLELLGWNVAFDVESEYQVSIGSTKNYVDYSLSVDGSSPVLFVEVKGYDTSLTDSHRSQLNSYLRQTDVDWGLLTNGEKYEILRRENVPQGVEVQTVADIQLSELPYRSDYVSLLSKEALESGHAEELAQRIFDIRGARQKLKEHKDKISEEITDTLTEFAGEVVSQEAKTEAKVLVDRLVEELEDQTEEIGTAETDDSTEQKSFWSEVEENTGIVRTEDSVQLDESKTAADIYADFIKFLFKSDYLSRADLPIESGRIRYILNTEMQHKDGSDMTNPKEIIDGVFLETHQNTANKKKRIVELGEKFGSS